MRAYGLVFAVIIFMLYVVGIAYAAENFDFNCDTPVTVTEQFDGEIKYNCIVKNTGNSFLQLLYETQPEQNPINPGLAIGFLNVSGKETKDFLLVAVSLVIVAFAGNASGTLGNVQVIGAYLQGIFNSILAIVVPATIVVALKEIWELSKEGP